HRRLCGIPLQWPDRLWHGGISGSDRRRYSGGEPRVTLDELQTGLAAVARRALDQACEVAHPVRLSGGASAETWKFDLLTPDGARPCILRRSATNERNRFATSVSK